jgi:carboxypeptidase C (cathepsin A)
MHHVNWIVGVASLAGVAAGAQDTSVVVTKHTSRVEGRMLSYTTQAGRLPIRPMDTEEPHGYMFYVAYRMPSTLGTSRPITFLWGGGPSGPALGVQFTFGPKRIDAGKIVDYDLTLLTVSDLVFVDPIGTGFSRPAKAEYGKEFYGVLGDQASVAELIRVWLAKYDAARSPVFLYGVSYGTWRASGVTEILERNGIRVTGVILNSGGVQLGPDAMPRELVIAHRTPGRAATAFHHGKLSPEVGRTLDEVRRNAEKWAVEVYAPALARVTTLTDAEREDLANQIAKYTGYPATKIDRATLNFAPNAFLNNGLLEGQNLYNYDGRQITGGGRGRGGRGGEPTTPAAPSTDNIQVRYLRTDLGYRTDLAYLGSERGYMPAPGPAFAGAGPWQYNSGKVTPEIMAAAQAGEGPPGTDAWLKRAMDINPKLKVLIAVGLYDSLNSCSGNLEVVKRFPELTANFTNKCYLGGHQFQRLPGTQEQFARDFREFIVKTLSSS